MDSSLLASWKRFAAQRSLWGTESCARVAHSPADHVPDRAEDGALCARGPLCPLFRVRQLGVISSLVGFIVSSLICGAP